MSFKANSCSQAINCCSHKCPVDQVICMTCCIPISVTCNGTSSQTIFQTINPCESISGSFIIKNELCSASCILLVRVIERDRAATLNFAPGVTGNIFVEDLVSVSATAIIQPGGATTDIVRGEISFQLRKKIQLDC